VGVVNEAVEDGIGEGWVADGLVPMLDWQLACDDGGRAAVAVFGDFRQIAAFRGGQDGKAPIVDDQYIHVGDGLECAFMAAISMGQGKGLQHARRTVIENRPPLPASLVPKSAGDPAFAEAGGSCDRQVLMSGDPPAIRKTRHDAAVKATGGAQVQIPMTDEFAPAS